MKTEPYVCPVKKTCPYNYDACFDPTKFCRIIEDTPEHFSIGTVYEKCVKEHADRIRNQSHSPPRREVNESQQGKQPGGI